VPTSITGTADIELAREPGANVLVVAREGDDDPVSGDTVPRSLIGLAAASLALSSATIDVVDFTPIDNGLDVTLGALLRRGRLRVHRRRGLAAVLREARDQVKERIAVDDMSAPARVLLLYGVHRARDLDTGGMDGDPELADALEEIVRDGPEVGVHVWAWCETVGGLGRRLPGSVIREFAWRVAGRQSPDDSQRMLGGEEAGDLRVRQVLLANDDRGLTRRCSTYTVPTDAWLAKVLDPGTEKA
jgi:hypothetical protein